RPEHVQHYLNTKMQGLAPDTVAHHRAVLCEALARAEKNGLIARNVVRLVDAPRTTMKERTTLTVEEVATNLLPALQGHRLAAAFLVLFSTGLRRGEILGLRWADIDVQRATLHIQQTVQRIGKATVLQEPKTASSRRTLPIPEICQKALRQHKARQAEEKLLLGPGYVDHGLVFCKVDGCPISPTTLNKELNRVLVQAGLPHVRVHDARHTFATLMLQ